MTHPYALELEGPNPMYGRAQAGGDHFHILVLFTEDGNVQAVVIEADTAYGGETYAYPFDGFSTGWDPSYSVYTLPYDEADLDDVTGFEYDDYDGMWD